MAQGARVEFRCTDDQKAAWIEAAGGFGLSDWIKATLDAAIVRTQVEPAVTVPTNSVRTEPVVRTKSKRKPKIARTVDPFEGCETKGDGGWVFCPHCDVEPLGFPRSYVEDTGKWVCCQTPLATIAA